MPIDTCSGRKYLVGQIGQFVGDHKHANECLFWYDDFERANVSWYYQENPTGLAWIYPATWSIHTAGDGSRQLYNSGDSTELTVHHVYLPSGENHRLKIRLKCDGVFTFIVSAAGDYIELDFVNSEIRFKYAAGGSALLGADISIDSATYCDFEIYSDLTPTIGGMKFIVDGVQVAWYGNIDSVFPCTFSADDAVYIDSMEAFVECGDCESDFATDTPYDFEHASENYYFRETSGGVHTDYTLVPTAANARLNRPHWEYNVPATTNYFVFGPTHNISGGNPFRVSMIRKDSLLGDRQVNLDSFAGDCDLDFTSGGVTWLVSCDPF